MCNDYCMIQTHEIPSALERTTNWKRSMEFTTADRMQKCLDTSNWGVQETADYFRVTRGTVGNWTSGRVTPSLKTMMLWAHLFNVPMSWLVSGAWPESWQWPEFTSSQVNELLAERSGESRLRESNSRPSHYE